MSELQNKIIESTKSNHLYPLIILFLQLEIAKKVIIFLNY